MADSPKTFEEFFAMNPDYLTRDNQDKVVAATPNAQQRVNHRAEGYRDAAAVDAGYAPKQLTGAQQMERIISGASAETDLGRNDYMYDRSGARSTGDVAVDTGLSAVQAVGDTFGAVVGLGSRAVDYATGQHGAIMASDATSAFDNFIAKGYSDTLNEHNRAYDARRQVMADDSQRQFEGTDQGIAAKLRKMGREFVGGIEQAWEDPVIFSQGTASAAGSLYGGMKVASGLRAIGRATLGLTEKTGIGLAKAAVARGVIGADSTLGSGFSARAIAIGDEISQPLAIGMQEGGAAMHQSISQVMAMKPEDLMVHSQKYRDLIAAGVSPEEAQMQIATNAGDRAAVIQGIVGAVTGRLVSKFERNPFAPQTIKDFGGNILREGVEETTQGATGQLASNISMREANNEQDLLEGVGEQAGLGLVYGIAGTGISAPNSALHISVNGMNRLAVAVGKGTRAILRDMATNAENSVNEGSQVADHIVGRAMDEQTAAAPDLAAGLAEAVAQSDASPEAKAQANDRVNQVMEASQFSMDRYNDQNVPVSIRETLAPSTNKFDAMQRLADVITGDHPSGDKLSASVILNDMIDQNRELFGSHVFDALDVIGEDHPLRPQLTAFEAVLSKIGTTPKIVKALGLVRDMIVKEASNRPAQEAVDPSTTPVPTADEISRTILEAEHAPDKIDPNALGKISYHIAQGNISVSPAQMGRLKVAAALVKGLDAGARQNRGIGPTEQDFVTKEISTSAKERQDGNGNQLSTLEHMRGITRAIQANDPEAATSRLNDFRKFAQHLQNKLEAINRTLADNGKSVSYRGFNGRGKAYDARSPQLHLHNQKSVELAQQIAREAAVIGHSYNEMVTLFPELEQKAVGLTTLDESLNRPSKDVVKFFTSKPAAQTETQTETQSNPEPDPVAEDTAQPKGGDQTTKAEVVHRNRLYSDKIVGPEYKHGDPNIPKYGYRNIFSQGELDAIIRDGEMRAREGKTDKYFTMTDRETPPEANQGAKPILRVKSENIPDGKPVQIGNIEIWNNETKSWDPLIKPEAVVETKPEPTTSRITPEQAKRLNDEQLQARLDRIQDNFQTLEDKATFVVLNDEMNIRETEAQAANDAQEAADQKAADELAKETAKEAAKTEKPKDEPTQPDEPAPEKASTPVEEPGEKATPSPAPAKDPGSELKGIAAVFPSLIGQAIEGLHNWFGEVYNLSKEAKTRTIATGNPFQIVRDILASTTALSDALGSDIGPSITTDVLKSYTNYLKLADSLSESMAKNLQLFLKETYQGSTFGERLSKGEQIITTLPRGKLLSIVERNDDGTFQYNQELLEGAILAALQWTLVSQNYSVTLDVEAASKILGIDEDSVTYEMIRELANGMSSVEAVKSLARTINRYWGFSTDKNAPLGYADGIVEGLAAELVMAMQATNISPTSDLKLLNKRSVEFPGLARKPDRYNSIPLPVGHPLKIHSDLIEKAILFEPETQDYIGAAPTLKPKTQLRNPNVPLSTQQEKTIEVAQNTPHFVNPIMSKLMAGLSAAGAVRLFAFGDLTKKVWNVNHLISLDGNNRTIFAAFEQTSNMIAKAQNWALDNGKTMAEAAIHYAYEFSRVNRLQMQGPHNTQASKYARELILPTNATLDLKDENSADHKYFMMALAQALGQKIHQQSIDTSQIKVLEMLEKKLPETTAILQKWLKGSQSEVSGLDGAELDTIRQELGKGGPVAPVALHAVVEYLRYKNASSEERAAFETQLYIEADGITNGPANAMAMMTSDVFTPEWIEAMKKVGMFLDGTKNTNDFRQQRSSIDLYKTVSNKLQSMLGTFMAGAKTDKGPVITQLNHSMRLMIELGMNVTLDNDRNLVIDRGATKNPLTITIYGSGAQGIAGNIAKEMIELIYERMSLAAQAKADNPKISDAMAMFGEATNGNEALATAKYEKFTEAFKSLTERTLFLDKFKGYVFTKTKRAKPAFRGNTFETVSYDKIDQKAVADNLLVVFVNPMISSIQDTMSGDVLDNADLLRQATQAQSIFVKYEFIKQLKVLADKKRQDPNWKPSDFISKSELDGIMGEILKKYPLVSTEHQNLLIGGKDTLTLNTLNNAVDDHNARNNPLNFSSSLFEKLRTPGTVSIPDDAGVAGIPLSVISLGDAQMIQYIMTMENPPEGILPVFDGVHMKLSTVETDSVKINQAAHMAWQSNPLAAVSRSYNEFMASANQGGWENIGKDQHAALVTALFGFERTINDTPIFAVRSAMNELITVLDTKGREVSARQRATARIKMTVDQMASVGLPYVTEGEDLSGKTSQQVSDRLNEILREEYAADGLEFDLAGTLPIQIQPVTEAETKAETKPEPKSKKAPGSLLEGLGSKTASGARSLSFTSLRQLYSRRAGMPAIQAEMLGIIIRSLSTKGYRIVMGTQAQLAQYATDNDLEGLRIPKGRNVLGATVYNDKTIYLVSDSTETLIHELIHAATFEKVAAFYNEDAETQLTTEEVEAMTRIEQLMMQFLNDDTLGGRTTQGLKTDINGFIARGEMAHAMNEFMAWNLSNQELAKNLSKVVAQQPMSGMVRSVLQALKTLIFGRKRVTLPNSDVLSNLRFNTQILMNTQPTVSEDFANTASFQSTAYGTSDRLTEINDTLHMKIGRFIAEAGHNRTVRAKAILEQRRTNQITRASLRASRVSDSFVANGFAMNTQEKTTFDVMVTLMTTAINVDPNSVARLQEYYAHVMKAITPTNFLSDPDTTDQAALNQAQSQMGVLLGKYLVEYDLRDRSSILPAFIALATVNDQFREILSKIAPPKWDKQTGRTLDIRMDNIGTTAMEAVAIAMSGEGRKASNVQAGIDGMVDQITATARDRTSFIERMMLPGGNLLDATNDLFVKGAKKVSNAIVDKTTNIIENTDSKLVENVAKVARGVAQLINEENFDVLAEGSISSINKSPLWLPINELLADLVGRVKSNATVYDMIKSVSAAVEQTRQQFREKLPLVLDKQFSRALTKDEKTHLFYGMARTDLSAMKKSGRLTHDQVMDLITDSTARTAKISQLEASIRADDPRNWRLLQQKSQELAHFMNTHEVPTNLLRNALAVANLYNEGIRNRAPATDKMIREINQLVTLYSLDTLSDPIKTTLTTLANDEKDGMKFMLSYLEGRQADEIRKAVNNGAAINHYKGYVPTEAQANASLIIIEDSEHAKWSARSYVRVGPYEGSAAERGRPSKSYYFAPVRGRAPFSQGIVQNIRPTAAGVDLIHGFTNGMMTAGRITDKVEVRRILRSQATENGNERLMPVMDRTGEVIAFERAVDPSQLVRLDYNTNISEALGIWHGRQIEEQYASVYNHKLVDAQFDMYEADRLSPTHDQSEYMDLFGTITDPVIADAMKLMPNELRDYIKEKFGPRYMVRRELVHDAIGYRAPSVGDAFTGNTRWSEETQKTVRDLSISVFGNKAYKTLVNAERVIQNLVTDAKLIIVVKSVVVPMANFTSNILQMMARGIPIAYIVRNMPRKIAEVNSYIMNRDRLMEAEAELGAVENDPTKAGKLKTEIQVLKDAQRNLSIWPLIEAGEFSSISDIGLTRDEILLSQGRLNDYMEAAVNKLPESVKTLGRYAWISRDTALFRAMQRSIEYGDFLAKALTYDDLINRKKLSRADTLGRITEEFVNYNRLPGRARGYVESIGLMWFLNFKIRSAKVALSMIRNNPVHAMFSHFVPTPDIMGNPGSPISDNIVMGDLGRAIGPGQGLHAIWLNPWINLGPI